MSTYTGVTNFEKNSLVLAHPVQKQNCETPRVINCGLVV